MSLIVQKFGGTSVANTERIFNVADIATSAYKEGNQVVVVVSAQGDTTDDLIAKAAEINDRPSKREMDVLLSTGEMISMSLLAMAIQKMGYPVISLTGWQAGVETDINYSEARIRKVTAERIRSELDRNRIVIVAGFQGINKQDDITTLGRGGSDTTAVAIAASLDADLCQIYTDVDGVYTADPRLVPDAHKLSAITYDEMLELASLGAQVLHNRSVEMAKKYNVDLEVISSFTRNPGTKVKEGSNMEKMNVSGVARDNNCARVAIINLPDEPGVAFRVFSLLSKRKINVDIILQSVGQDHHKSITFTIPESCAEEAEKVLRENQENLGFEDLSVNTAVAKVSIVGAGMASNAGVAAKMFEALASAGINIRMISTSEIKISVLINEEDSDKAVKAIHAKFFNV
ncbi:aspartate kinase [Intestinibacillus sp. Marseille-P6563]|uniref:aspartate kinase n=1 Tax=Intestinibacillus sp. Marseille-P6563 TaxID=2364792 RepID=UPI000F05DD8E|nr:aspartate kinase [Intestinibacillus sp. Marseille-P6563]